jgi:hypothetical protein
LPDRTNAPISPRHSTSDDRLRPRAAADRREARFGSRLAHAFFPCLFTALAVGIVYLLLYFYLPQGPGKRLRDARGPLIVTPRLDTPKAPAPEPEPAPPPVEAPALAETPPAAEVPPAPADVVPPAVLAYAVLEQFLKADHAAARVPLVEPAATVADLDATVLKGSLPQVSQIAQRGSSENPLEQVTDFSYHVTFSTEGKASDYAILVRRRGEQPPKVFLPAFLDLVGGRLQAFASEPNTQDPVRFHAIVEPVSGCHEDGVPNPDRKFTLKLLPGPIGREIARAYCSNHSRIRTMLEEPDSPVRWGTRVAATITLQWNHREDPARPFLELIEINSPDWNP